jgi:hypothetical protein
LYQRYKTGEEEFYTLRTDPFQLVNKVTWTGWRATVNDLRAQARARCRPLPPDMPAF